MMAAMTDTEVVVMRHSKPQTILLLLVFGLILLVICNSDMMMELELDIPIWWMYLSFPVGFVILALFSMEMTIHSILDARKIQREPN